MGQPIVVEKAWILGLKKRGEELEAMMDEVGSESVPMELWGCLQGLLGYLESTDFALNIGAPDESEM